MTEWVWPVEPLRVTDEFGMRIHPIDGVARLHRGIDLSAYLNQEVWAAADGDIVWAGYNGGEGNSVHVRHADGSKTKYFHNNSFVRTGGSVNCRETIAHAGTTGASTGVHVHYETHTSANSDSPVNPRDFMASRGAPFGKTKPAGGGSGSPVSRKRRKEMYGVVRNVKLPGGKSQNQWFIPGFFPIGIENDDETAEICKITGQDVAHLNDDTFNVTREDSGLEQAQVDYITKYLQRAKRIGS